METKTIAHIIYIHFYVVQVIDLCKLTHTQAHRLLVTSYSKQQITAACPVELTQAAVSMRNAIPKHDHSDHVIDKNNEKCFVMQSSYANTEGTSMWQNITRQ
jgi:hypothetical protein